ncbi:hypothetical protein RD792_011144 [Penstemon davidsonii]|uniref:Uncharacterized protein n=1 Tax=Penstemon davidsonii TaxID=160366 RepID=A0ABR0D402_9LAMI|nr:hypothetical protein RD792_011144 [Penstemon davidsonii]
MLLEGDLGLLYSAVASAAAVVVGLLVVRWKWRRMLMRREEIRRRMAFASEEAVRAELEEASGYSRHGYGVSDEAEVVEEEATVGFGSSPGRQIQQYPCEVCFCPTTTRCKQCKSVHYCSGKCQIIHWRQGHKEKCHSLSTDRNSDTGLHSFPKKSKQYETESTSNAIGIGKRHITNPNESSSGEPMFSSPTLHVLRGKNDTEVDTEDYVKGTDMNLEASVNTLLGEYSSSNISSDTSAASDSSLDDLNKYSRQTISTNMSSMKPLLQEQPIFANPDNGAAVSSVSNMLKSGCIDTDEQSEIITSSNCSGAGSEEHSLSEPSTPSSGFWGGTVEPIRTKIDALDKLDDAKMLNHRSSCFSSSGRINVSAEVLGSKMNKFMEDAPRPVTSIPKKSTAEAASSEVNEDGLKFAEPLIFSCELSNNICVSNASVKCISKMEEAKLSRSSSCHERRKPKGHVPSKDVEVSSLQSLSSKPGDNEIDGTNDILKKGKCRVIDSREVRASEAQLSSSNSTSDLDVHSVENERVCRVAAAYLENSRHERNSRSETNLLARKDVDQLRPSHFIGHGSLGAGNVLTGRYEASFSYELFVKLYNWKKVELFPRGLLNCGNSCYANAVLQCLTFTPPLTAYFLQGLHSNACENKEWCFTCEFEALVKKAKEGYSPLSPARIISKLQRLGSHLGNGKEEDAHEFLRYAIDAMQFICVKEARNNVPSSLGEETTLMGLTFGGYLRSKIECMRCRSKSEQHERIMDLTVEIGGDIGTLEDALCQFTRSEILDGENKYHCGRCKSYEKAKKKLRILDAPNVLTIALKRFQSGKFGKLNKAVKFPEILNIAPYMSGTSDKSPIYALYGVVVHLDIMNASFSGHYVCYVKNNLGRWFQADDSTVQAVDLGKVLSKGAYMLLYARCSPRAPRRLRKAKSPNCKHPAEPWDHQTCSDCFYLNHTRSYNPSQIANSEDDSSSEHSSTFFSEAGSHSTESSTRESTSTDESFDQMLGDLRNYLRRPGRNSSDSDTSSPSSSPSPLHLRHSPLADLDRYSSDAETSGSCLVNASSNKDCDGFWTRTCNKTGPDSDELVGSHSCRVNESCRLSRNKSHGGSARGVYLRTTMGRMD